MTKMNTGDRAAITAQIMQKVYGPKLAASAKAVRAASDAAYKKMYENDLRRMNKLPEGWLPEARTLGFRYDGEYHTLRFNKSFYATTSLTRGYNCNVNPDNIADDVKPRRFLVKHGPCGNTVTIAPTDTFYEAFGALVAAERAHEDIIATFKRDANEVMGVLRGMSTFEAVKDKWPEITVFIRQASKKPTPGTALAPNFTALNERLGLS